MQTLTNFIIEVYYSYPSEIKIKFYPHVYFCK